MKNNLSSKIARGVYLAALRILYRPKVIYTDQDTKEKLRQGGNIIISNHVSHNDGQIFYLAFPGSGLTVAKDWMDKKILKWITAGGNFIPVNRFGTDISWIRTAADMLKEGKNIIIFPEGKTSKGEMNPFKSGFAMLSVMTGADIIYTYNNGEYHKFFGRRLKIYAGSPLKLSVENRGMNSEYLNAEAQRFQNMIQKMKEDYKND